MASRDLPADPVSLVEALLRWAVEERSTDIHFDPRPEGCKVRARIDGLLKELHGLEPGIYPKVASRIKVLSNLDLTEKRRPQDGRFSLVIGKRPVDFRVSAIPTLHGESLSLRVLDRLSGLRAIDQLGFSKREQQVFRSFLSSPSGMILVTGPTGAGKTTTLYGALVELALPERNVVTIEDPIEYEVPGVVQTAVHGRLEVTFASLLRSILRHDPDVIMVGEVRDAETADVSVRAALTGHLVLTSLHTGRAAGAVSAMLHLGVRPFSLASALRGVVAQQLVRIICNGCKTSFEYAQGYAADPDFAAILAEGQSPSFSVGMGCDGCFRTGYRGRRGLFEVLPVTEGIQGLILRSPSADEIEKAAVENGMVTLRRNGFRMVLEGLTTVEEVLKAIHIE